MVRAVKQQTITEREMITVDEYEAIRRAFYVEKKSRRQIAREQGHSRKTIRKALESAGPGRYTQKQERVAPLLGPYKARIAALLQESEQMPRKQRYTGHKIYQILKGEGYAGSEPSVRRYIGAWRRQHTAPPVYLPLSWEPGADAQADWGEGEVDMAGQRISVAVFSVRLCYSRRLFVMAFPNQKTEAFLEAQVRAFHFFEGVPRRISYDNLKTAVKTILTGHEREEQVNFRAFRSHYLFESYFCNPGQGHEKGGVEHAVGYSRRNFLVPIPQVDSFEELNACLLAQCLADEERTVQGQPVSIRDAWRSEKDYLLPLPAQDYPCCISLEVRLNPYSQVVFETNRYSVPVSQARMTLTLRVYPFEVEILKQGEVIARHRRCYGHGQDVFDPLHYLPLLAQRPAAFEYAKPLREWRERWPSVYEDVLARLRSTWPDGRGVREFIQILQLHSQHEAGLVEQALQQALNYGCVHYEGVRLCLNQLLLPHPQTVPLPLEELQLARLASASEQPIDLQQYDQLISGD